MEFPKDVPMSTALTSFGIFSLQPCQKMLQRPHQIIDDCKGFEKLYEALMGQPLPRGLGYRVFEVYRHGEDLGTLFEIRQGLPVWLAEKKMLEAQRRRSSAQG